jgi:hypothetical protein
VRELEIPPLENPDEALEMIRFWIDGEEDSVMLNIGSLGDTEPESWGMVLADIARHAVRGLAQYYPELSEDQLLKQIQVGYRLRMRTTDMTSGSLAPPPGEAQ